MEGSQIKEKRVVEVATVYRNQNHDLNDSSNRGGALGDERNYTNNNSSQSSISDGVITKEQQKKALIEKVEEINKQRDMVDSLVESIYKDEVKELQKVLSEIESENKKALKENYRIPDVKLENWVLQLPILIDRISERAEFRALDVDIADALKQYHWDTEYLNAKEKDGGSNKDNKVTEMKALANKNTLQENYVYIVKNRIYKKILAKITSAEKVFYSVKTILGRRL